MTKIRLTKHELKKQKDDLKRFRRFLPTLELKATQLLREIDLIQQEINAVQNTLLQTEQEVETWADVFAEEVNFSELFEVAEIVLDEENIAGVDIPILKDVQFTDHPYDLISTPLWVDRAIEICKIQIQRQAAIAVAQKQQEILREEWRITNQRIKLFENVKIPQARENIRTIQIFLGDQQTAAVVRGKIAKANLDQQDTKAAWI